MWVLLHNHYSIPTIMLYLSSSISSFSGCSSSLQLGVFSQGSLDLDVLGLVHFFFFFIGSFCMHAVHLVQLPVVHTME